MRQRVVGLGAGGHARVVLDVLLQQPDLDVIGLLDVRPELRDTRIQNVPVLGDDRELPSLRQDGVSGAFIGVGSAGSTRRRRSLYELAVAAGFEIVPAIHARATISTYATLGAGPTVLAGAVVNAGAIVGANVLINTGAIVEHDVMLSDHVHVASGARLGGGVVVGEGTHIGLGAVVREGIRIGAGAIVAAGAVVVKDVDDGALVMGVPARVRRTETG